MKTLYAFLACLLVSSVANAELMATFVQDETIFGAGNNTWALQVTSDTDWQTGNISLAVDTGFINYVQSGFPPANQPGFGALTDSGVFGKDFAGATIAPGPVTEANAFSASWGTTSATDTGTFYIGAFTLSEDANGTVAGRVVAQNPDDEINGFIFNLENWSIVDGAFFYDDGGTDPGLEAMYVGSASLNEDLQGAFSNRNYGTVLLEGAVMLSDVAGGALADLSPMAEIVFADGTAGATGSLTDGDGDGKYDIEIDGDWASVAPGTELAGELVFSTAVAGADPAEVRMPFSIRVPEPSTYALAGLALFGLVGFARRK